MSKNNKMKVLYASFEAVPFVKLGGLGDVAGTLPASIRLHNTDIRVIIPFHSIISEELQLQIIKVGDYELTLSGKSVKYQLHFIKISGVIFYLIKCDKYFKRENVYGEKDDLERFAFFCNAILDSISHMDGFVPDILHCNDWHTALANLYIKEKYKDKLGKHNIKTIYTIHNLLYQGKFKDEEAKNIIEINSKFAKDHVMYKGKVNLMKCGISVSDCVTTPSPSYAKEILTFEYGAGLEDVLKTRKNVTHGILNGIDYVDFNPAWDTNIRVHFTKDLLERRLGDKIDLQKSFKLDEDSRALLFCVACRFYEQKGIRLILDGVQKIIDNGGQIIFLGDGDKKYKEKINAFKKKYKGKVGTHLQFDPLLPHNVYAGADVLLMPSKFEPCGIAQMMAMHYGALPLVRSTGGLKDTVHNYAPKSLICNGFVFKNYNTKEYLEALDVVFDVWNNDKKNWVRMQKRAMNEDFSWKESGRKYTVLYTALLNGDIEHLDETFELERVKQAAEVAKAAAQKAERHAKDRAEMAEHVFEMVREVENESSSTNDNSKQEIPNKTKIEEKSIDKKEDKKSKKTKEKKKKDKKSSKKSENSKKNKKKKKNKNSKKKNKKNKKSKKNKK